MKLLKLFDFVALKLRKYFQMNLLKNTMHSFTVKQTVRNI